MNLVFYLFISCFISVILCQTLSDVPWDSSNVVIAYYKNEDSTCSASNAVKLEVRSSTECYEDAYTQYQCNGDGTITYTEYMNETCTDITNSGNFNPDDMGCQLYSNDSDIYYRFYCYNDLPSSINPYRAEGHIVFPYAESIYNDRSSSENCTNEAAAWELYKPNYCYIDPEEDPIMWERIDDYQWNIKVFSYNDTDCLEPELNETELVSDGTCESIYGFESTFDALTASPTTASPTPRPTSVPVVSFKAEFATIFELTGFPCDNLADLENDPQTVGAILEAGYANAGDDSDITVVIKKIETIGDSCTSDSRRLLQDTTDLNCTYSTYCGSQNTCVNLEEDTTADFLTDTLVEEMSEEYNIESDSFGVNEESVTTSAVVNADGDTVTTGNGNNNNNLNGGAIAGIVIGCIVFVTAIGILVFYYYKRKNKNDTRSDSVDEVQMHYARLEDDNQD